MDHHRARSAPIDNTVAPSRWSWGSRRWRGPALVRHAELTSMVSTRGGTDCCGSWGCPSSVQRLLGSPSSSRGRSRTPSSRLDRLGQAVERQQPTVMLQHGAE
jgi:hypothetical protein